ncbi:DDT domain-containing protein [Metarhizium album ARSEF 1941]|uniref:DDT domain-containing protein n=1 Tax=Metarhizium album (strain ARSEF 1941) TaxID=1081103 RepID=A0A0B2WXR0_METAS|nr:DDT domain-containing protein [Metarhizium album ARSEF 1941]KHN97650.1 DDT domain-containing protein [Metarhizium album ARSEF 1941]
MVLFKRKPVRFLPPADIQDENAEVWHIPQTGEIFVSYEDYLSRSLVAQLTGGREVEASFPEALKGPILRKVQFQTISRLDHLVDLIFDEFKHDYYPGEEVMVTLDGGDKMQGLVRDKTTFGPRILPDGSRTLPVTRYLVSINNSDKETIVTDEHICRNRGVFTKAMLRSFIKKTVVREAWTGAPWLVKHDCASMYHIDTRVPPQLRHDTKLLERKQLQAQKRAVSIDIHGASHTGPMRLPELKPATKHHKGKQGQSGIKGLKWPLNEPVNGINGFIRHEQPRPPIREPTPPPPPPPPPPPTKYPIEDLSLPPKEGSVRPRLKFLCHDPPVKIEPEIDEFQLYSDKISMGTVGAFLETWDTLNVYCEIFKLDSFTFDDFVEAMSVASEQTRVQLFDEIHCSVLKVLVDSEREGGKVRINLPELEDERSDEEGEDKDEDEGGEGEVTTPEPEEKPKGRATRSSLAKLEAERLAAEAAAAEKEEIRAEQESRNRAEELMREFDWIDHLRRRDFSHGGWERIMVGLLHQLSKDDRYKRPCEELLEQLVAADSDPTQEAIRQSYAGLDVNYRVKALQIICLLTMQTKAVRGYMEDCSETMTKYRKDRIDWQRQKKQAIEDARQLHEQRRELVPDPNPQEEAGFNVTKEEEDVKMADADESQVDKEDVGEGNDEPTRPKGKRQGRAPADKRKKDSESEKERKEKEKSKEREKEKESTRKETAKLTPQQQKQYNKILKEIQKKEDIIKECEEEVAIIENDLREADCPRTRVLGKDRFWNRYYWFERNGMPYGGLPTSSTAAADYANGCIWVQGPDDMEREGYIDGPPDFQNEYKAKFKMTVSERKAREENGTSVFTARQWGYISEPGDLTALIKWLDPRGFNELKLRKELINYKDKIAKHMESRKKYLANDENKDKKDGAATKRSSSRIREKTPEPLTYRCLQWENTMALEDLGHIHSDPPPPPRARKQTKKREAQTEAAGRGAAKTRRRG